MKCAHGIAIGYAGFTYHFRAQRRVHEVQVQFADFRMTCGDILIWTIHLSKNEVIGADFLEA